MAREYSFMSPAKNSKIVILPLPFSANIQFRSELNPLLDVFNWHFVPPSQGNFGIFLGNFNSERVSLLMHTVFTILISIIKLARNRLSPNLSLSTFVNGFQCLHYRIKNQIQKKFQDGNSVIEAKQLLGNLVYGGKHKFGVC